MGLLSRRFFRRVDRARLETRTVARMAHAYGELLPRLGKAHAQFRAEGSVPPLHASFQDLVDRLCLEFDRVPKRVVLRDRPRPHKRRGGRIVYEVHGLCDPHGPVEVYLRTAARAQPVALRTLLDTVLHEWVHHYDFETFGTSVHCRGFYERLGQLYRPARARLPARAGVGARTGRPATDLSQR